MICLHYQVPIEVGESFRGEIARDRKLPMSIYLSAKCVQCQAETKLVLIRVKSSNLVSWLALDADWLRLWALWLELVIRLTGLSKMRREIIKQAPEHVQVTHRFF